MVIAECSSFLSLSEEIGPKRDKSHFLPSVPKGRSPLYFLNGFLRTNSRKERTHAKEKRRFVPFSGPASETKEKEEGRHSPKTRKNNVSLFLLSLFLILFSVLFFPDPPNQPHSFSHRRRLSLPASISFSPSNSPFNKLRAKRLLSSS